LPAYRRSIREVHHLWAAVPMRDRTGVDARPLRCRDESRLLRVIAPGGRAVAQGPSLPRPVIAQPPACSEHAKDHGTFGSGRPAGLNGTRLESGVLIVTPGNSGGPWWFAVNGSYTNPALVAITTGNIAYPCGRTTCYRNFGRYIDTSVWNFIVANSLF